jgi:hypothetical protein
VSDPENTLGSAGTLISTRTCPHGAIGTPLPGVERSLTDWAHPTAMLSKRASPEDSTRLALTMVRSAETHTLTIATSPGTKRRTTMNETGSSSNGAMGGGVEADLKGVAQPLRAATQNAMSTVVRIDLYRPVSIRLARPGLI